LEHAKIILSSQADYLDVKNKARLQSYIIYKERMYEPTKLNEFVGDTLAKLKNLVK